MSPADDASVTEVLPRRALRQLVYVFSEDEMAEISVSGDPQAKAVEIALCMPPDVWGIDDTWAE